MAVIGTIAGGLAWAFGLYQGARVLGGVADGAEGIGRVAKDFQEGRIGLVAQVAHQLSGALGKVQDMVLVPQQALARGMISDERWAKVLGAHTDVITAIEAGDLPEASDLKLVQAMLEQLIPGLRSDRGASPLAEVSVDFLSREEEKNLRTLYATITAWLGETVDGRIEVQLVDLEGELVDPMRRAVGHSSSKKVEAASLLAGDLAGLDLATPINRAVQVWHRFEPEMMTENLTDILSELCIGTGSLRAQLNIHDLFIQEGTIETEAEDNAMEIMAGAIEKALKEKDIPLHEVLEFTDDASLAFGLKLKGSEVDGFYESGDVIGTRETAEDEHFFDASEDGNTSSIDEEVTEASNATEDIIGEGSAKLYIRLLKECAAYSQTKALQKELGCFETGRAALQSVKERYTKLFQQAPVNLYTLREALYHLRNRQRYTTDQHHIIAQAKGVANAWIDALPESLRFSSEDERADFMRALEGLRDVDIREESVPSGLKFVLQSNTAAFASYVATVEAVLKANEGRLQGIMRQFTDAGQTAVGRTFDEVQGRVQDLTDTVAYIPLAFIKGLTSPEVIARIAIGIFLTAAFMSAIFSGGGLSFMVSLTFAAVISIGLQFKERLASPEQIAFVAKPLIGVALAANELLARMNKHFVWLQEKGPAYINERLGTQLPAIRHPVTI